LVIGLCCKGKGRLFYKLPYNMPIFAFFILVLGFFLLYNTSKRAVLQKNSMTLYIQKYSTFSKSVGLLLSLFSICWFVYEFGLGIGLFYAFVLFMTLGSLLVILLPLRNKH